MSAAARRLFFALWPGDAVRQALFHWQTHHLPRGVRWQHRADLHVTLHFLGQVEASRLAALRQLGAATRGDGFTLVLDQVGYWPRPQILWAGPTTVPVALIALHERLGAGLREQGFATERRSYRPHVTLARKVRRRLGSNRGRAPRRATARSGAGRSADRVRGRRRPTRHRDWELARQRHFLLENKKRTN